MAPRETVLLKIISIIDLSILFFFFLSSSSNIHIYLFIFCDELFWLVSFGEDWAGWLPHSWLQLVCSAEQTKFVSSRDSIV